MTRRLRFRSAPLPGESMLGYMGRVAHRNCITIADLARIADACPVTHGPALRSIGQLADVMGVDRDAAALLSYYIPGDHTMLRLAGLTVPVRLVNWKWKRFCPDCLEESEHHRCIWDISLVSACPLHRKRLVIRCARCGHELAWSGLDPWACHACGANLRRMRSTSVPPEQLRGTALIYGLLGQSEFMDEAAGARARLPFSAFDEVGSLKLLHLLVMSHHIRKRAIRSGWIEDVHLTLNDAYDACVDWPSRLLNLEGIASKNERPYVIGRLLELAREVPESLRDAFQKRIMEDSDPVRRTLREPDVITMDEAAVMMGVERDRLRKSGACRRLSKFELDGEPVLSRTLVVEAVASAGRVMRSSEAAAMLGVSPIAFWAIVNAGMIVDIVGNTNKQQSYFFGSRELERFLDAVAEAVQRHRASVEGKVGPTSTTAFHADFRGAAAVNTVRELLNGSLRCVGIDEAQIGLRRYGLVVPAGDRE
ncbi:TniQ family protein [Azospirillum oleiclasticum]|nr:TniQ family protein [Azospirillum oleiclasticum]